MSETTKPPSAPGEGSERASAGAQPAPEVQAQEPASTGDGDGAQTPAADITARVALESSTAFPVVGVGASAGGLEALETFLGRLPRTGMAFIVIQHLAPGKESHLSGILSRSTRLPVSQATDGVTVEPDNVYVIPPGVNLAIFQGKLHLMEVPTAPAGEPLLPVDFFFQFLFLHSNKAFPQSFIRLPLFFFIQGCECLSSCGSQFFVVYQLLNFWNKSIKLYIEVDCVPVFSDFLRYLTDGFSCLIIRQL